MLSVQSPLQLAMSNDNLYDDAHASWNAWRGHTNLPTPPSSDPPRRLGAFKQHFVDNHSYGRQQEHSTSTNGVQASQQQHLTLPPIAHIDRHWPSSSPLTPPDDEMHASPISLSTWRDSKPGPSRLHSPMNPATSPFPVSPTSSPEDEYERYEERYDPMDEQPEMEVETESRDWDWEQERRHAGERDMDDQTRADDDYGRDQQLKQSPGSSSSNPSVADWVTNPSQLSAHFIAEKACEMVCYLWFSSSLGPRAAAASRARREHERAQRRRAKDASLHPHSPPFASRPLSNASTAALQFSASPEFISFMAKLLATTQVSQSVIVLSLHYIFRLKETNEFTLGKPGSEFRVAVCALMLANKFVDDNTYTNKTWSEVSGIALEELNKMEREFLLGVNFQLFVDAQTYDSWLNLLKGLVLTKEREFNRWRERRRMRVIVPRIRIPDSNNYVRQANQLQRARSTSPHHPRNYAYAPAYPFTFTVPSSSAAHFQASSQSHAQSQSAHCSPNRSITSKRTAADAFSPISASFDGVARGGKRPTGLVLDIPAALASASSASGYTERAGSVSAHPAYTYADSLRKLERMSLATPIEPQSSSVRAAEDTSAREDREQTLAAPYRGVDAARRPPPPHLYFYSLASSPLASSYAAVAAAPDSTQTSAARTSPTDPNVSITEEPLAVKEIVDVFPAGADRKARLRYADSHASTEYAHDYSYGYGQSIAQAQNNATGHQTAYHAPVSSTTHRSSVILPSSSHLESYPHSHYAPSAAHHLSQPDQQLQQLPPLTLALSVHQAPVRSPTVQAQGDRASPLPGFASLNTFATSHAYSHSQAQTQLRPQEHSSYSVQVYTTNDISSQSTISRGYSAAPNPAPVVECAWSAPPSETVDGVYAPAPRHVHPHGPVMQQQCSLPPYIQTSAPTTYGSCASPAYTYPSQQQYARHSVTTESVVSGDPAPCTRHENSLPERAAFANAGPPGVVHFYPYARSGSLHGAEGYRDAYSTYSNAGKPVHQSYSTTASPEGPYVFGYDYSSRERRF
ncbi:hypothetical protein ACEPAI_1253 [Sanghuangporus weigelae]